MDEILTFEEIKARYAPEWVVIGDVVTDEQLEVVSGKVLFHSPERDVVHHKLRQLGPGRYAVHCLGTWPENMEVLL